MLNLVVFSKDRAAQLDLLLRSVKRYVRRFDEASLVVLWKASDAGFARGYELVRRLHPDVRFVAETGFRAQTLELVDPARELTAFLVDDDVFREPFSLDAEPVRLLRAREEILAVSLRMGPQLDRCYSEDRETPPPPLDAQRAWDWRGEAGDWGYPMSLDGNVFRTAQLLPLLHAIDFFDPNSLEARLAERPLAAPRMVCFERSRLLNVPANRVQDTCPNRHGGVDPAALNERFLGGERIALAPFRDVENRAPHHELDYEWQPAGASERVGLLVIATGPYKPYAERLIASAQRHLLPGHELVPFLFDEAELGGRVGFPAATLYRYHVFTEQRARLEGCDRLYYCDADMLFVADAGEEILGRVVATEHPGYVGLRGSYEDRPASTACVGPDEGERYYCGGFNGGEAAAFLALAETIAARIDEDDANGITAVWHDESHLNRHLADCPPDTVLSPAYCYPEVVSEHYRSIWPEAYEPRLVALDKEHGAWPMPRRPKVSVIVPCYDYARFLPEAVESICAQTLEELEIVIVDDGSPDDTAEVAERLIAAHPERDMRLLRQENTGLPGARNSGIAATTGEYVCCLDADDRMSPTYLEELVRVLDARPDVSIVYGDRTNFGAVENEELHHEYDFERLKRANILNVAALYRRTAWEQVGGFHPMTSYEDWDFWIGCGERGHFGLRVPQAIWHYRVREGSMYDGAKARDQQLKAQIVLYHPELYSGAERRWAEGVLAGEPDALALGTTLGEIPTIPDERAGLSILAIMPAFNEGDVIAHAIRDLVESGIDVYLLDNASTDDTVAQAEPFLGRGLVRVERFPDGSDAGARAEREYVWREILARAESIAVEQGYDWTIFTNPDEFRESPWPDTTLREGIELVDRLGYTAINFELFNFRPVDDGFAPGADVREHLTRYEPGEIFDMNQMKAWRSRGVRARLEPSGGHLVEFPGRRLFPVPFLLRHYPIRGETHGRRKVFAERLPRFAAEERADGWHVQYDAFAGGSAQFLRDPAELERWDGDRVRARLLARASRELLLSLAARAFDAPAVPLDAGAASALVGLPPRRLQEALGLVDALVREVDEGRPLPQVPAQQAAPLAAMAELASAEHTLLGNPRRGHVAAFVARSLREPQPVAGARSFTALAFADELLADPHLLAGYGAEFAGGDDATLVIVAPQAGPELLAAVSAAGLDGDDAADLLAVPEPAPAVHALYTRRPAPPGLARVPRFDDSSVRELRALAERHWRRAA